MCRIVRAEGDPEIARSVRFSPGAVGKGVAALRSGGEILTDVRMVEAGISKMLVKECGVTIRCFIDEVKTKPERRTGNSNRRCRTHNAQSDDWDRGPGEGLPENGHGITSSLSNLDNTSRTQAGTSKMELGPPLSPNPPMRCGHGVGTRGEGHGNATVRA